MSAVGASTVAVGAPWLTAAGAATDDDLAFANFSASAELLVRDYYSKLLEAKLVEGRGVGALRRGRSAASRHFKALGDLLIGAGDVPPVEEDFAFEWPARTFRTSATALETGHGVLRALLGAYQSAAATVTEPTHRVLYASLAASIGQQIGALASISGRAGVEPFPVALDLEAASTALERYLG